MSSYNPIGIPFIELPTVDSTNNYAMGLVRAGMAQHGMAVFAHEQTIGKGQRNKQWASQKNQNIAISFIVASIPVLPSELFLLSMASALAVHRFMSKQIEDEIKIKWPNDIYWRDRKAAGILIENLWQGKELNCSVIGIGININQTDFGELGLTAVSMKQITGRQFEPLLMAKDLCAEMDRAWTELTLNALAIKNEYRSKLYKLNEKVKLKKGARVFDAVIRDVTMNGELLVEHGLEEKFAVGEVEWMNLSG